MHTTYKRYRRPLGQYRAESRVELHTEKAFFRQQAQVLRDMCDRTPRPSVQRQQFQFNTDGIGRGRPFISTLLQRRRMAQHHQVTNQVQQKEANQNAISSNIRWLLTRSARMQRVNNAGFAMFRNRIKDRVVSADGRKKEMSLQRQRSMCDRNDVTGSAHSRKQRLQCDVLGPDFCTDCTKISQHTDMLRKQRVSFPMVEVHTRSLVAPEKVEKIFMANPNEMFQQQKKYACGCTFNPKLEISTPIVYTPHEVFERIRKRKQMAAIRELERELEGVDDDADDNATNQHDNLNTHDSDTNGRHTHKDKKLQFDTDSYNTARVRKSEYLDDRPSFMEEKTEPPMDLSVSVKFIRNDN